MRVSTYVFLDTNILFRIITQGQPGCELKEWEALTSSIDSGKVTLLLPEVTNLELQNQFDGYEDRIETEVKEIQKQFLSMFDKDGMQQKGSGTQKSGKAIWNELADFGAELAQSVMTMKDAKKNQGKEIYQNLSRVLAGPKVVKIPFGVEVLVLNYKRGFSGNLPKPRSNPDYFAVTSLVTYFSDNLKDRQLLFCTENLQDFAVGEILNPRLAVGLPPTQLFKNLADLMAFLNRDDIVEVPKAEQIEQAKKAERELEETTGKSRFGLLTSVMQYLVSLNRQIDETLTLLNTNKVYEPGESMNLLKSSLFSITHYLGMLVQQFPVLQPLRGTFQAANDRLLPFGFAEKLEPSNAALLEILLINLKEKINRFVKEALNDEEPA